MVRVTVPATSANMGSGYDSIGIALEMYNVIDLAENDHIDISDKNGQFVPKDESNLIYQCAKRVYDECGKPLSGLTIIEDCAIPQTRGLGSSSACTVAGTISAASSAIWQCLLFPRCFASSVFTSLENDIAYSNRPPRPSALPFVCGVYFPRSASLPMSRCSIFSPYPFCPESRSYNALASVTERCFPPVQPMEITSWFFPSAI